jgi:hypothetical protein
VLGSKIHSRGFVVLALLFSLIISLSALSMPSAVLAETAQAEAKSAIVAAQNELITCYQAVANASSAGANVTSLIQVLDQAGGNLSRADLAYKTGDNAAAQAYANQSLNLLTQNNVTARASALKSSASQARFWGFMINVVGSLVGAVAVVCCGFAAWTLLKKRYSKDEGVAK